MEEVLRTLLVDDDPMVLRLLSKILGTTHPTDTAESVALAKEHLSARPYDLILTDLRMPGESGADLIRFVRDAYPQTAIVVVSGISETDEAKSILDTGVYGYIVKPFEPSQIRIAVENALRRRKLEMRQQLDKETLQAAVTAKTAALESALRDLKHAKEQSDLLAQNVHNQLFFVNAMMNAMPCPMFYKDINGIYLGCNPAFREFLKRPLTEIIGKSIQDIAPQYLASELRQYDIELIRNPGKQTFEKKFIHADGDVSDVVVSKATYLDASGQVAGIVGVILDITERKVMERRLIESETRFRRLVEGSIQGILIHQHLKPVFVNSAFAEIYGYTEDDLLNLPDIRPLVAESDRDRLVNYASTRMIDKSIPRYYEYLGIRKDGSRIWLECRAMVVGWGGDTAIQMTVSDITQRKKSEKALVESEARLKAIWDSIQIGVMVVDIETRQILDVNPEASTLIGLPRESIVGRICHSFVCPNEMGKCPVMDRGCMVERSERVMMNAAGEKIPVIKTASPGSFSGRSVLIESLLEISSLKKAELELEKSHKEMVELVSCITAIFIGLSPAMTIVQWNREAEKVFHMPAEQLLNLSLWEASIPWDWDAVRKAVEHCVEGRLPVDMEDLVMQRPDGKNGFLSLRMTAMESDAEKPTGILIMGADITERKILESQLAQAQKLESIGQLAAGIAHEINTPIQYVGDNVRFMKDAFDAFLKIIRLHDHLLAASMAGTCSDAMIREAEQRIQASDFDYFAEEVPKAVEQTLEGVASIGKIVRSMKEFCHPGVDEMISVDINCCLESSISVSRNEWKYVAEIETDFDQSLPLVPCFPGELSQVFLNIIINAAHAIEETLAVADAEKGFIRVSTHNVGDVAEIRISDTGGGVPEAIRHRIFDPFFTTKNVGKGTGQGLAIAHRIVTEKHRGVIRLESEPAMGATFIISIPCRELEI